MIDPYTQALLTIRTRKILERRARMLLQQGDTI